MSHVPPEIDALLWQAAESRDPRVVEEFGERYPAFRGELVQRLQMVRELRSARPDKPAPNFRPGARPARRTLSWPAFAAAGVALATIGWASVATVQRLNAVPKSTEPQAVRPSDSEHAVQARPSQPAPFREPDPQGKGSDGQPAPQPPKPFETLVTCVHESVSLRQAIQEVASVARIRLEFAPGFEEQTVTTNYVQLPAKQVLDNLGQTYGFTAYTQTEDSLLIVPAMDPEKPQVTVPEGSGSEPSDGPKHESQKKSGD